MNESQEIALTVAISLMKKNGYTAMSDDLFELRRSLNLADGGKGEAVKCMLCGETEPYTGTCGSGGDPRALCNAAPQAECAPCEAQPVKGLVKMSRDTSTRVALLFASQEAADAFYAAPTPERADAEKDAGLTEVVEHTIATLKRQIDLIAERAPGNFLDKTPVVRSLRAHQSRLERAILAANKEK